MGKKTLPRDIVSDINGEGNETGAVFAAIEVSKDSIASVLEETELESRRRGEGRFAERDNGAEVSFAKSSWSGIRGLLLHSAHSGLRNAVANLDAVPLDSFASRSCEIFPYLSWISSSSVCV